MWGHSYIGSSGADSGDRFRLDLPPESHPSKLSSVVVGYFPSDSAEGQWSKSTSHSLARSALAWESAECWRGWWVKKISILVARGEKAFWDFYVHGKYVWNHFFTCQESAGLYFLHFSLFLNVRNDYANEAWICLMWKWGWRFPQNKIIIHGRVTYNHYLCSTYAFWSF